LSKYQDYLSGGYDAQARAADLQEQREMSQAQMLFDIAGAAADFAGNTEGGSIAERLANSVSRTQLTDKIGTRAANMLTAKQAQTAEKRQLDMAARTTSLQAGQAAVEARRAETLAGLKKSEKITGAKMFNVFAKDGNLITQVDLSDTSSPDYQRYVELMRLPANEGATLEEVATTSNARPVSKFYTAMSVLDIDGVPSSVIGEQVLLNDKQLQLVLDGGGKVGPQSTGEIISLYKVNDDGSVAPVKNISQVMFTAQQEQLNKDGYSIDSKTYVAALARAEREKDREGEFATKLLYRRRTDPNGIAYYERKEMLSNTDANVKKVNKLINMAPEPLKGIEKWTTDPSGAEAWLRQQESIADLYRTREGDLTDVLLTEDVVIDNITLKAGIRTVDKNQLLKLKGNSAVNRDFVSVKDTFMKTGFTPEALKKLTKDQLDYVTGLPTLTDKDYIKKFGLTKQQFEKLLPWQKEQKLGLEVPEATYVNVVNPDDDSDIRTIDVSIPRNRAMLGKLLDEEGFVETNKFTVPVAQKTTGFVTQQTIEVGDQTVGPNTFVELNPSQVAKLPADAIRRPLNGVPKTLLKKDGKTQIVAFVGGNFYGPDGKAIDLNSEEYATAMILGENNVYEKSKNAAIKAQAAQQLEIRNIETYKQLFGLPAFEKASERDGFVISNKGNLAAETINIAEAIKKGTGPYAQLRVFANSAAGLTPESWGWQDMFNDTVVAKNWVDIVNVSVRVALASNPRLAEGEQVRIGAGLMSSEKFLANPQAELAKAIALKKRLAMEYTQNLKILASTDNATMRKQAQEQNFAIDMFNSLLADIPMRGFVDDAAVDEASRRIGPKTIIE